MTSQPTPKITRRRGLPLIWIIPIIAALVSGWLVYRDVIGRGERIVISFANGSGIEAGKTMVEHNGVAVGVVKDVALTQNLDGVRVTVELDKTAKRLAAEDSKFWIVKPRLGFGGVSGLETLLTGVRIQVQPGTGKAAAEFSGLEEAPQRNDVPGKIFELIATELGSLNKGVAVYYREMQVGNVIASRLADDGSAVLIRIQVNKPYDALVRINTQFWNAGGIDVKVGLLGAQVNTTSLESITRGGVAFATPDEPGQLADENARFTLNKETDKDWKKWAPKIPLDPKPEW